ncbi:MAG: hypothetical protein HY814_01160 [Candidatus Riflebacteria bacterium]|nr:hypothetical protein [Candidatus Riflebacteria bacterium]
MGLVLAVAPPLCAEEPAVSVSASIGVTSTVLGDQLRYGLTVSAPPGTVTTVVGLGAALAAAGMEAVPADGALELASVLAAATTTPATRAALSDPPPAELHVSRPGESEVTVRAWRVSAFRPGDVTLQGAQVRFHLPDGTAGTRPVPPVTLAVRPVQLPQGMQMNPGEIFGVKPPVGLVGPPAKRWWLGAAVLLVGLLLALAVWRPEWLRRLFGRRAGPPPPPKPPHVLALDALDLLVAERLLDRGLTREYFGRLSEILRAYLDGRFGLRSMEATTEELSPVLRSHEVLGKSWFEQMRRFFVTCDLAKFARHVPPGPLTEELTAFVRTFVRSTMIAGEPPAAAGPGETVPPPAAPAPPAGAETNAPQVCAPPLATKPRRTPRGPREPES